MTDAPDITATVILHGEGLYAVSALASLSDLVRVACAAGLTVETQIILDRADELTSHIVAVRSQGIDTVKVVSFGDLGLSRNAGTYLAHGRFLSFLDGDDLWGERWLLAAFEAATRAAAPQQAIWHPEHLYVFSEPEFDRIPEARLMQSSDAPGFDATLLVFANLWSANAFTRRELHVRFPYRAVDRNRGLGIEDWSWNLETLGAGIHHCVVPGTVHLIRKKGSESLDQQNASNQLLPYFPPSFAWRIK
jgi:hypothetical protein